MNARSRDERAAGIWLGDASVLRIDTISRHVVLQLVLQSEKSC